MDHGFDAFMFPFEFAQSALNFLPHCDAALKETPSTGYYILKVRRGNAVPCHSRMMNGICLKYVISPDAVGLPRTTAR